MVFQQLSMSSQPAELTSQDGGYRPAYDSVCH